MSRVRRFAGWVWYPWLVALFPIIFLYSNNFGRVFVDEFWAACGLVVIVAGLLVGLFWLIVRDIHKAGVMTLAVSIPFFAYGPAIDVITSGRPGVLNRTLPVPPLAIGLAVAALLVVSVAVWLPASRGRKLTVSLNILAAVLVAFNIGALAVSEVQHALAANSRAAALAAEVRAPKLNNDSQHPDVYYIIMDAYPSNESLMAESDYDNSGFTSELEKRGFFVAYDSRTNYPVTLPSLASSLNMRYLGLHEGPPSTAGFELQRSMIADSDVAREFLSLGYTYLFVISGFDTSSTIADFNVDHYPDGMRYFPHDGPPPSDSYRKRYWPLVYEATMLSDMGVDYPPSSRTLSWPTDWEDAERALATFDEVSRIAQMPQATISVVHFVVPHYPVRFTRDGQIITGRENIKIANGPNLRTAYFDQLNFVNERTLQMIDDILSKSDVPPVIIIQGDHGSLLGDPHPHNNARYFKILNAYHFSDTHGPASLTPDISPVNSFRIVFNTYFGTRYDLLENRYFKVPRLYEDLFDLVETTTPPN